MKLDKVILSGGGTGGHIFPALSIANEIKRRYPDCDILFVGAQGRMEMEKVPAAGYEIIGLPVMGFPRKPSVKMLKFFVNLFKSASMAKGIVKDFKPQLAIGVGGYASGPLLRAAAKMKVPTLIQEQNSYAGITNKLLSKKVNRICVAYENMQRFFPESKIVLTGNPVRRALVEGTDKVDEAVRYFELPKSGNVLLIVGGSLGARTINEAVLNSLDQIREANIEVIWQTGAFYFDEIQNEISGKKPGNLHVHKFITRMDLAYSLASVVVSRAGAGTISEICLVGLPSVLVPSPNVAEDHQTKNAMALVEKEAAVMVRDSDAGSKLLKVALDLVDNEERRMELSKNVKNLARPDATKDIVDQVEKLVSK